MGTLLVDGEVSRVVELGFDELVRLPGQVEDLAAIVPGRNGGAVELRSILDEAGVRDAATHVTLTSSDGAFRASVPLAAVDAAVVAYREGDAPLPESRGGPFRFFVPESAACASGEIDRCANVKFLASIRLTAGRGEDTRPTSQVEHAALHSHDEEET